ncbi:MAG: radical SAM protein, partial [Acidobacteriota bacterium]
MSIRSIVLKLAGRCNLNCSYCYVYNRADRGYLSRPKFISARTFDATLARIREYCDDHSHKGMHLSFHGGEPTLIGPERFDRLASRAREVLGERLDGMGMQTNATLIDERWLEVFTEHGIQPGVSLDGPPHVHDAERVDHRGRGSYLDTVRGLRRLQDAGFQPGVLCVINPEMGGLEIYEHFLTLGIRSMGFLLPDASHDTKDGYYGHLGETPVADYLIPIFDRWFSDDDPKIKVRVFRDLLRLMFGGDGSTDAYGNGKMEYLVVETD